MLRYPLPKMLKAKADYLKLVPRPDPASINTGLDPCPMHYLISKHGPPRDVLSENCQPVTSPYWKRQMVTMDVGPFVTYGHKLFLGVLKLMFAEIKEKDPLLYSGLKSDGVLCCRKIRGGHSLSNHGLGLAWDALIFGVLDKRGDGKVLTGTLELYSYAKKYKLYSGMEFPTEDGMHLEASEQLVKDWEQEGLI